MPTVARTEGRERIPREMVSAIMTSSKKVQPWSKRVLGGIYSCLLAFTRNLSFENVSCRHYYLPPMHRFVFDLRVRLIPEWILLPVIPIIVWDCPLLWIPTANQGTIIGWLPITFIADHTVATVCRSVRT